jgi:hypothetical protein
MENIQLIAGQFEVLVLTGVNYSYTVRFQVLMAAGMTMTILGCCVMYQTTQCNNPEDSYLHTGTLFV